MKILVIGGGGREYALIWKLAQSRHAQGRLHGEGARPRGKIIAQVVEKIRGRASD